MSGAGEQFGRYLLHGRLAFGGMAEIFLAELRGEEGFARRLVIKRVLPQFCADPVFVRMFVDEAVLAARISHPNVVQVLDFGHVNGVYFLAMELVDGVDLRRIITPPAPRTRLTVAETAALGEAAARGLAYAHSLVDDDGRPVNLVHRDVSPHNIMVARTGEVKVTDFGIAKAEARVSRTATGMLKGKLAYMSPEQGAGRPLDKRSDQFSLGVVLWECLAGQRLFAGGSDLEILRRVVAGESRPLIEVNPEVPEPLAAAVQRCLERDPQRRWHDLSELADALAAFRFSLGAAGVVQLGTLVPPAGPLEPPRRTLALEAAGPKEAATGTAQAGKTTAPLAVTLPAATQIPAVVVRRPTSPRGRHLWLFALAALGGVAVAVVLHLGMPGRVKTSTNQVMMLRIETHPTGARLLLGGRDTGLVTPASLPVGDPSEPLPLGLARQGYVSWHQTLWPLRVRGQLEVTLSPVATPAPTHSPLPPPAPIATPATATPSPVKARAQRSVGRGLLSLRTTGAWVEVFHGSRKLGTTPLHRVEVPAGRLRLRLVNELAGIDRFVELELVAGEELQRTIRTK